MDEPKSSVEALIAVDRLGEETPGWQAEVSASVRSASRQGLLDTQLLDAVMGQMMSTLRGRVPAARVVEVIHELQTRNKENG